MMNQLATRPNISPELGKIASVVLCTQKVKRFAQFYCLKKILQMMASLFELFTLDQYKITFLTPVADTECEVR